MFSPVTKRSGTRELLPARTPTAFHPSAQGWRDAGAPTLDASKKPRQPQRGCLGPRRTGCRPASSFPSSSLGTHLSAKLCFVGVDRLGALHPDATSGKKLPRQARDQAGAWSRGKNQLQPRESILTRPASFCEDRQPKTVLQESAPRGASNLPAPRKRPHPS